MGKEERSCEYNRDRIMNVENEKKKNAVNEMS
jgi:hypothetical protein